MNAFPLRDNCPVPQIDAIEGNLVENCIVPEAPPACPEVPIVLFPPPSFNFGCYAPGFVVASTLTSGTPKAFGRITYPNKFETGNCQPVFNFGVSFACESPTVTTKIVSYVTPKFKAHVTQAITASGTCNPDFDFEVGFPCTYPHMKDGIFMWKPPGDDPSEIKLKLIINLLGSSISSQVCDWSLRSEVSPSCPTFDQGDTIEVLWDAAIDDPVVNIFDIVFDNAAFVPEDHCPYLYDLSIKIPPLVKLDEESNNSCVAECVCCEEFDVLVKATMAGLDYPRLEVSNNHKIKLHYAYRATETTKVEADVIAAVSTFYLKDDPDLQVVNSLSASSGACHRCPNKVVGDKISIKTGGIDCDLTYVCYISRDRFGTITAHYAKAEFKNGILVSATPEVSDPGSCSVSCIS